jgi:hypothetical protein
MSTVANGRVIALHFMRGVMMTIVLETTPEIDIDLRREAERNGQTVEEFALHALMASIEHEPNEETIAAIEEARAGKGKRYASAGELFRELGIPCEK